jgi:vacuolar-type H+-ATPase subunit H
VDEAQKKADNDIKEAARRSKLILEEAEKEAKKEVQQLLEMAKTKEEEAINLVISNVV